MRKHLRKSDIREINAKIADYDMQLSKKGKVELEDDRLIFEDDLAVLMIIDGIHVPTLKAILANKAKMKAITVDMGAIRFVTGGADIMRPGITEIDDAVKRGDFIVIVDESHKKPLAIGQALSDAEDMKAADKGKVVKNLHYVGDGIWKQ